MPIAITLLTLIMELSLDKCAKGKPRFGEESCYFAGLHGILDLPTCVKCSSKMPVPNSRMKLQEQDASGPLL